MRCLQGVYYCWAVVVVDWCGYRCWWMFEVGNNAVWAGGAEEFKQMIWLCSTCNYLLFFCCEDNWCTSIPFCWFYVVMQCTWWYAILFGCCMHRPWALHCWQLPWLYASVHHSTGSFLLSSCTLLALLLYFVVYKRVFWILRMRSLTLFCVYIVLCFCCCICLPYMGELQNEWMNEWIWPFNVASTVRNLMPVLLSVHGVR